MSAPHPAPTFADSDDAVRALATRILDPERGVPVVLLSTRSHETRPLIDPDVLSRRLGPYAEVWVIRTGAHTWRLGDLMPERTHVYGGAGRVYPPGDAWHDDPYSIPLRFVHDAADAPDATERLIEDVDRLTASGSRSVSSLTQALADVPELRLLSAATKSPPSDAAIAAARIAAAPSAQVETSTVNIPQTKPGAALRDTQLALAAAEARVRVLEAERSAVAATARADVLEELRQTRVELARALGDMAALRDRHAEQLASTKKKARTADAVPAAAPIDWAAFVDADNAVRHAITCTWAERVPAEDKADFPLPVYVIGSSFASSLAEFDKSVQARALRCIVDVLTDRAKTMPSRRIHILRTGPGGDNPGRVRESDGAVGFRASVETGTASARRLHYWKLEDGRIELARVVVHDSFDI